jgi:hypothetical protein
VDRRNRGNLLFSWALLPCGKWAQPLGWGGLLLLRRIKDAVDLYNVVVEQALDLDHGSRRVGGLPQSSACALSTIGA